MGYIREISSLIKDFVSSLWALIKRHKKASLLLVGIIIMLFLIFNASFYVLSYIPRSCTICHYMDPYYKQWATSRHNNISCIRCHPFRPAFITVATIKYLTGIYNPRPHAIVEDRSCLQSGCHSERLLEGKVAFKNNIIFDHKQHVGTIKRGERLKCASCHAQIVQGKHISVDERVCFLCHFKGAPTGTAVTGCPSCHGTPTKAVKHEGFVFNHDPYIKMGVKCNQCHIEVSKGQGFVPEERCFFCHVERTEKYKDPLLLHQVHVTKRNYECFSCHEEIIHKSLRFVRTLEVKCQSCHETLHNMQMQMYMGVGAKGVSDTPSIMFATQVSCEGCHLKSVEKTGIIRDRSRHIQIIRNSCVSCHGKLYAGMVDTWIQETDRVFQQVSQFVNYADEAIKSYPKKQKRVQEARNLISDAKYNLIFIKDGKAAHNVQYALRILATAWEQASLALKAVNASYTVDKPELIKSPSAYCNTLCHSRIIPASNVSFKDMAIKFPHQLHSNQMGIECTQCHPPEKHRAGIVDKKGCKDCHHTPQTATCRGCHPYQDAIYHGDMNILGIKASSDIMAKDVSCRGCHELKEGKHTIDFISARCVSCHNKGYSDLLNSWIREINESQGAVETKISQLREKMGLLRKAGLDTSSYEKTLSEIEHSISLLKRTKGVHNYGFSMEVISRARDSLDRSLTEIQKLLTQK